jgi:hypothetical protein
MDKQTQEALKMAIKAIENLNYDAFGYFPDECANDEAIQTCKEALEQSAWQGLTDDEVENLANFWNISDIGIEAFIAKIEHKLKEKNHG